MSGDAVAVIGAAESPYTRHPPATVAGDDHRTEHVLADAVVRALADAGLRRDDVDGLAVSSFFLAPDGAIDLAWRLGMPLRWLMQDTNGGAGGLNMLQHAVRAVAAGDASAIVVVAGDRVGPGEYERMTDNYNRATSDYLAPLPLGGPNALFSFVTQRHMRRHGLERGDYARVSMAQRWWAARNPGAVYREPLTLEQVLDAPAVTPPLHRYDCVPPVTGADAVVVAAADRVARGPAVLVRAVEASYNHDSQEGDGLDSGLALCAPRAYERAGLAPGDADVIAVYDDYPVMVCVQLDELGLVGGDLKRFLHERLWGEHLPVNTSGGQLSAGQAGAGAGMHGLVEVAAQLRGQAGERQVEGARIGLVSGYGMVLWRYGACANVALLERA